MIAPKNPCEDKLFPFSTLYTYPTPATATKLFIYFIFSYSLKNADIEIRAEMLISKRYILRSLPIS